jgi:hypothetical protein
VKVLYKPDRGNYQPDGKGGGNGVRSGICLLWKLGSFGPRLEDFEKLTRRDLRFASSSIGFVLGSFGFALQEGQGRFMFVILCEDRNCVHFVRHTEIGFVLALGGPDGPKIGFVLASFGFVWVRLGSFGFAFAGEKAAFFP